MDVLVDVGDIRQTILEIVSYGRHNISREVYSLRYNLFLWAASYYFKNDGQATHLNREHCEVLEPFPSCFYDFKTKTRDYNGLQACIKTIPTLNETEKMTKWTSLPELTWKLLLWIFTNKLTIEVVKESEISEFLTEDLRERTKLSNIPSPSIGCHRFEISHELTRFNNAFLAHKAEFGSFFAYHGSPGQNFHSIIHRGLRCSLNVRAAFGPGTYLTSCVKAAKYQSIKDGCTPYDGIACCVAIVEVIKHPSVRVVNQTLCQGPLEPDEEESEEWKNTKFNDTSSKDRLLYVVNSDEFMKLRHLLVYYPPPPKLL